MLSYSVSISGGDCGAMALEVPVAHLIMQAALPRQAADYILQQTSSTSINNDTCKDYKKSLVGVP